MSTVSDPANPKILPVRRVHAALRQRVVGGDYRPGQKLPTEREFGEEFGVSRLTVAKAMAQLVTEGLVNRHRGRGTFVEHGAGDSVAARRTQVTFISPAGDGGGVVVRRGILEGLHAVLTDAGYYVGVDFYADHEQHLRCLAKHNDAEAAGFVLWPDPDVRARRETRAILEKGFPIVLVDTYLRELDCDYVVSDNTEGATRMVDHLADLGHERIVYLTVPMDRSSLRDRMTGFLRGAVYRQLDVSARDVIETASPERDDVERAIDRILAMAPQPTAIFASNDYVAMAAYWSLRDRGLDVPGQISVAGYDDIDAASHFAAPLTTMTQDYYEIGRVAGQILLERLRGQRATVHYQKFIEPRLQIRQSTQAYVQRTTPV